MTWNGLIFSSGTITATGNGGFFNTEQNIHGLLATSTILTFWQIAFTACTLSMVPSNLATDETLDIDWEVAFDANNGGSYKIHDFAQVSATNAAETVIVPGNESVAGALRSAGNMPGVIPSFWRFSCTIAGTTPSMSFLCYAALVW